MKYNFSSRLNGYGHNILMVCHLRDGSPKICLDLKEEFVMIYKVQIKHGRVAVQGFANIDAHIVHDNFGVWELLVLDLETGKIILRCAEDFNFNCDGWFVLERDRILIQTENKIRIAKFWIWVANCDFILACRLLINQKSKLCNRVLLKTNRPY